MQIPEKVRIGSCDYAVELTTETLAVDGRHCHGRIDYNNHKIQIDTKLGDEQQRQRTLLHEVLHGMMRERGLELEDEESVVEELAKSLHQIIRDNPEIFQGERGGVAVAVVSEAAAAPDLSH